MFDLLKNERLKLYKKVSTWVLLGIVVGLTVLGTLLTAVLSSLDIASFGTQLTVEEYYTMKLQEISGYSEENGWTQEEIAQETAYYRYLLEHEIDPADWRVDAVSDMLYADTVTAQQQLRGIVENNDWRAYLKMKMDAAEGESDKEKALAQEMLQCQLDMDIQPVSTRFNEYFEYYGGKSTIDSWKNDLLTSAYNKRLMLLRGTNNMDNLLTARERTKMEREIAVAMERLRTDTRPVDADSFPGLLDSALSGTDMLMIAVLVTAASLIAGEFNSGTIKLLLITPHERRKVYWAKAIVTLEMLLVTAGALLVLLTLVCGLTSLFRDAAAMQVFTMFGQVVRMPYLLYLLGKYLILLLPVVAYGAFALMISAVTRKTATAIILSVVLLYGGSFVTGILSILSSLLGHTVPGAKFLLFAHSDLSIYFPMTLLEDMGMGDMSSLAYADSSMTLGFSVIVLLVYTVCFLWIGRDSFCRKDVK